MHASILEMFPRKLKYLCTTNLVIYLSRNSRIVTHSINVKKGDVPLAVAKTIM